MLKVALTGNKFSGKSTISKELKKLGYDIFEADVAIKFMLHYNIDILNKIKRSFGESSIVSGFLNSNHFNTEARIKSLLEICKPELFDLFEKFCSKLTSNKEIIFFKSSIIHELNIKDYFDKVCIVYAPYTTRLTRLRYKKNDTYLDGELSTAFKNKNSDFIIHNYDNLSLDIQINNMIESFSKKLK